MRLPNSRSARPDAHTSRSDMRAETVTTASLNTVAEGHPGWLEDANRTRFAEKRRKPTKAHGYRIPNEYKGFWSFAHVRSTAWKTFTRQRSLVRSQ